MNTFGHIKEVILGHLTRNGMSMQTEGGVDMVAASIHSAQTYIQRKRDFQWAKTDIYIQCDPTGDLILNAVEVDTKQPVKIKRINVAYGTKEPSLEGGPKVDYISKNSQVYRQTYNQSGSTCERVIHSATKVFASPRPEGAYKLWFEAVKWIPPLVNESDTNFLLEYGFDFMLYRSLKELNFYLKEDQRFQINNNLLTEAEMGLLQWDDSLLSPTETEINL